MKIIDLLNKIANGEEVPEKIKLDSYTTGKLVKEADSIDYEMVCEDTLGEKHPYWLFNQVTYNDKLNDEVEIIEEDKKIEKIDIEQVGDFIEPPSTFELANKINEIIDKLNEMDNK